MIIDTERTIAPLDRVSFQLQSAIFPHGDYHLLFFFTCDKQDLA